LPKSQIFGEISFSIGFMGESAAKTVVLIDIATSI
jgi:hypothetical protein